MKTPKKITPDNLKTAIIEIRYNAEVPYEIIIGFIFDALSDYNYTNQINHSNKSGQFLGNIPHEITFNLGGQSIFYNDKIQLRLAPNALVFDCVNNYIGWEEYKAEIGKMLDQLTKVKQITQYTRVGMRYINEYPAKEIKNLTKFEFSFSIPEVKSSTFFFRTEFYWDNYQVILSLQDKTPIRFVTDSNIKENVIENTISVIDVDVITDNLTITNYDDLIAQIENNHTKEKEVFFKLLKNSYLESLNPQYS